jgi:hypothetical protein
MTINTHKFNILNNIWQYNMKITKSPVGRARSAVEDAGDGGVPGAWGGRRRGRGRWRLAGCVGAGGDRPAAACRARGGTLRSGVDGEPGAWGGRRSGDGMEEKREGRKWKERRKGQERRGPRRQFTYLCRVPTIRHSAKIFLNLKINFAECRIASTRQRYLCWVLAVQALSKDLFYSLCRVPTARHSAKLSLPSASWTALGKVYFIFLFLATKLFVVCSYTI